MYQLYSSVQIDLGLSALNSFLADGLILTTYAKGWDQLTLYRIIPTWQCQEDAKL